MCASGPELCGCEAAVVWQWQQWRQWWQQRQQHQAAAAAATFNLALLGLARTKQILHAARSTQLHSVNWFFGRRYLDTAQIETASTGYALYRPCVFRSDTCRGGSRKAWHGTPGQMQVRGSCRSCERPQSHYCAPWWLHTAYYGQSARSGARINHASRGQRPVPWSSNVTLRVAASQSPVAGLRKGSERGGQTNGDGEAATVQARHSVPDRQAGRIGWAMIAQAGRQRQGCMCGVGYVLCR